MGRALKQTAVPEAIPVITSSEMIILNLRLNKEFFE